MTTIQVVDIAGKSHIFTFAPYATIKDLVRSQVNAKFRITSNLSWLSCCGKPLLDCLPLDEISRTVFMHGRLNGGAQCLKGCENEAGSKKFDSMVRQYELKCTPDDIILFMCVFKHLFSVACSFLDERNGSKTDLHNDLYTCIDSCDGTFPDYMCMSCQPFFLKSIKIENEYNETKKMFQERQSCSTSDYATRYQ